MNPDSSSAPAVDASAVDRAAAWRRWDGHIDAIAAAIALRHGRPAPPKVDRHARLVILDTLGCALAGRLAPEVAALEAQLCKLDPGAFRIADGKGLGLGSATKILAIAPTWYEACEGHAYAHGRPGIAVLAALLPLALARDASLGELIDAYALGYEIGARAGGWLRLAPGVHADGNWPGLGVAAAVAALLGLPADAIVRAVDIAACQLPASLYLPIRTGRSVRNIYLAHSASIGFDAAFAAAAGIDAPADALGYYAEHYCPAATEAPPPAAADLLLDAYLKPLAAVRHVHYGAIAAGRMRRRLNFDTSAIERIELAIYEEATIYCGNPQPQTQLAAQFSLTFGLAAMLRFGTIDASSYREPQFHDAELRRLERLVDVRIDPELTSKRQRGARLTIVADGRSHHAEVAADDAELLLDDDGAIAKFMANAAPGLAAATSRAFCETLLDAPRESSLRDVWRLLDGAAHDEGTT